MNHPSGHQPLLGRLANLGWFARHGEVAATQSLAILLEEPALRDATIDHLRAMTGSADLVVESFHSEQVHDDLARPDLEGQDPDGKPTVVVEAKFGAALTTQQAFSYIADQVRRNEGNAGVFALLVPAYRQPEADEVIRQALDLLRSSGLGAERVATTVITWDELLEAREDAGDRLDGSASEGLRSDILQLRSLCRTMVGLDLPPLGAIATGSGFEEREEDLRRMVRDVTSPFRLPSGRLLPTTTDGTVGYFFRYIPGGPRDPDCFCAVGVVSSFAAQGQTPFWLRYHHRTSSFRRVADRIMASPLGVTARGEGGHIWLPLPVSADRSGAALLEELTAQIEEIRLIARGAE